MRDSAALAIEHVEEASPRTFRLVRLLNGESSPPVTIPSPYEIAVEGLPSSNLMRELRWYLEQFLDYPFPPETDHGRTRPRSRQNLGHASFRRPLRPPRCSRMACRLGHFANPQRRSTYPLMAMGSALRPANQLSGAPAPHRAPPQEGCRPTAFRRLAQGPRQHSAGGGATI